jgi:hypothetical protein
MARQPARDEVVFGPYPGLWPPGAPPQSPWRGAVLIHTVFLRNLPEYITKTLFKPARVLEKGANRPNNSETCCYK